MVRHLSLAVKIHQLLQMVYHHIYQTMTSLQTIYHKTMVTSHQPTTIKRQALVSMCTKSYSTIKLHPHHILQLNLIITSSTGHVTKIIIQIYLILCNGCSPSPVPSITYQIRFPIPIPVDPIPPAQTTVTTAQKAL